MSNKTIFIVIAIIGIIVFLGALFAHQLGLSSSSGLGTKKIAGMAVGAIIFVVGIVGYMRQGAGAPA